MPKGLWERAAAVLAAACGACLRGPRRHVAPGGCGLLQLQALLRGAGRRRKGASLAVCSPSITLGLLTMQGGRVERVPAGGGVVQRDS